VGLLEESKFCMLRERGHLNFKGGHSISLEELHTFCTTIKICPFIFFCLDNDSCIARLLPLMESFQIYGQVSTYNCVDENNTFPRQKGMNLAHFHSMQDYLR